MLKLSPSCSPLLLLVLVVSASLLLVNGFIVPINTSPLPRKSAASRTVGGGIDSLLFQQSPPSSSSSSSSSTTTTSENQQEADGHIDFVKQSLSFSYIFEALDPAELATLLQAFEQEIVPQGSTICKQGEKGDYFYVVESGDVKFSVNGKEVGTIGPSQTFGELALLAGGGDDDEGTRAATATAYGSDVKLWKVGRDAFQSALMATMGEERDCADDTTRLRTLKLYAQRVELKKKLEKSIIESFDDDVMCGTCESIMSEMEHIRPIARPAYHPSMNGDWCMVRASSRTLDMALIMILSKISQIFPFLLDFKDCYITLGNEATKVTGHIYLELFGGQVPFKMKTFTKLAADDDHPEGTMLYESLQGFKLLGIHLALPDFLASAARPLEITYLDEDIMIARNDGGDPHLLVRIRSCPEHDENHQYTGFFEDARLLYGDRITRCLVDRRFGHDSEAERLKAALDKARGLAMSTTRDRLSWSDRS